MDMNDAEYCLYLARERAASAYRREGFDGFAGRVERGLEDGCSQVRMARFFIDPTPPASPEFIAAWKAAAAAKSLPNA